MEMDGSGGIPPTQPPPPAEDADEAAAALALTKRARKKSRYLSPPYTDTDVQEGEGVAVAGEEEEGPPPDVSAAAALSALLAAAPCYGEEVDRAALHFLKLHSRNRPAAGGGGGGSSNDGGSEKPPSPGGGGGGGHTKLNLSTGPAMPPGPVDGSPALAKKKKSDADGPMQGSAAPGQAQAARFAVNGTYAAANHAPPPERKKKYKKMAKSAGPPPLPKLTLTDIRSNLVMMIASLTATAEPAARSPDNLVGEMQGLLDKVDRILQGRSATAAHHH